MNHSDHVNLIHAAVPAFSGTWADVGAGSGAFTLALADCLGSSGTIYAVDQNAAALRQNQQALRTRFPTVSAHYRAADFTRPIDLPALDGLIIANALHFHLTKEPIMRQLIRCLKPGGAFVIVEYNVDHGNQWVPYPFTYPVWQQLAASVGLVNTRQLTARPSRFLREIYSAVSFKPA